MERERLSSRLGFILLSAGCAIGIGNVWKFPYMVGQNGGGIFVLLYLFFLLVMGIPVMTIEFSLGRASQKSPVRIYQTLAPKGSKWYVHGYVAMAGNYLLMMFYTVVAGWMIQYFFATASGRFNGLDTQQVEEVYHQICANPVGMVGFTALVVVLGFFICSFSLQKGVERVSKYMMLALLAIMVILAINSFTMDGAREGLSFYLKPDLEKMREVGIGNVIVGAMTQAFFTLSLGMGASLVGSEMCIRDRGNLWGALFFVFMTFAALTTVLAVFETILACCMDLFGWSRKKACLINGLIMLVLAMPCALGFNLLSGIHPLGGASNFMDLEDFLVSNIILPVGSLIFLLFTVSKRGWGWKNFLAEANAGKGLKVKPWMRGYMTYVLPFLFLAIFIIGLVTYFQ